MECYYCDNKGGYKPHDPKCLTRVDAENRADLIISKDRHERIATEVLAAFATRPEFKVDCDENKLISLVACAIRLAETLVSEIDKKRKNVPCE